LERSAALENGTVASRGPHHGHNGVAAAAATVTIEVTELCKADIVEGISERSAAFTARLRGF